MKSTSIEELIDTSEVAGLDAALEEDISNVMTSHSPQDTTDEDKMKIQLENLQNELNAMRASKEPDPLKVEMPPSTGAATTTKKISDIFQFKAEDLGQIIRLSCLFGFTTSPLVNQFVDNMIPYSLYNYAFLIKLVMFILIFRALEFFLG